MLKWLVISIGIAAFAVYPSEKERITFLAVDSKPYGFLDSNNKPAGTMVTLAKLLSESAHVDLGVHVVPAGRILLELKSGSSDLAVLSEGGQVSEVADKVAFISEINMLMLRLKTEESNEQNQVKLLQPSIGYLRGGHYEPEFWHYLSSKDMLHVPFVTADAGFEMWLRGRIDFLAMSELTLVYNLKKYGIRHKIEVVKQFKHPDAYLFVSKRSSIHAQVLNQLTSTLQDLHAVGKIEEVVQHLKLSAQLESTNKEAIK